jgi:hypothetical protein
MGVGQSKDTSVCLVIFNPAESKRILMNYLYTVNLLTLQEIPWFTMELVFNEKDPEIPAAPNVFHVRSNSYMFHKERMCRVMERKLPSKFTKVVFMDADLIFSKNSWYSDISNLLNTHDVVQGFENCHWMDLTYKKVMLSRPTCVKMPGQFMTHTYHPGFIWGFRRDWFKKHGFFDLCISGSGDTLSASAWLGKELNDNFKALPMSMGPAFASYKECSHPRITYLPGIDVYHLYHGSRQNRKYVDRHTPLNIPEDVRRLIWINKDGMYEWRVKDRWNPFFLDYFQSRDDDGIEDSELKA